MSSLRPTGGPRRRGHGGGCLAVAGRLPPRQARCSGAARRRVPPARGAPRSRRRTPRQAVPACRAPARRHAATRRYELAARILAAAVHDATDGRPLTESLRGASSRARAAMAAGVRDQASRRALREARSTRCRHSATNRSPTEPRCSCATARSTHWRWSTPTSSAASTPICSRRSTRCLAGPRSGRRARTRPGRCCVTLTKSTRRGDARPTGSGHGRQTPSRRCGHGNRRTPRRSTTATCAGRRRVAGTGGVRRTAPRARGGCIATLQLLDAAGSPATMASTPPRPPGSRRPDARRPRGRARPSRLVGDRRPQVAQRHLRLRHRLRPVARRPRAARSPPPPGTCPPDTAFEAMHHTPRSSQRPPVEVWAVLRTLGREGVAELVGRAGEAALTIAERLVRAA